MTNQGTEGWAATTLEEILPLAYGKGLPERTRDSTGKIPVIGSSGVAGYHSSALVSEAAIVVGRKGNAGSVHVTRGPSWPIDTVFYAIPSKHLDLRFCYYLLTHQNLGKLDQSTAIPSLSRDRYNSAVVSVPSLAEQRRIVAAIEEQFSRLDAAVASLERARANLKRYRAAVLQAAVTGGFVPQQNQNSSYGSLSMQAVPDDVAALPNSWSRVQLGDLLREPLRNGHSARASTDGKGVRTLTLTSVTKRDFSEKNTKLTTADSNRVSDLWLQDCDIFIERSNTPELVGTACIYRGEPNYAIFPDLLIRVRIDEARASSAFIDLALQSEAMRRYFQHRAQGISGSMPKIDQRTVEEAPISLPSLTDQQRIVAEAERQMSVIDALDSNIENSLKRANRLRQAILKRAFAGELVPQDPSDEPASVLLERIRVEQAAARSARPKRSANGKRNSDSKQPALL